MKLYTEEQVIKLTQAAHCAGENHNGFIFQNELEKITPIKLPTDEEIDKGASDVFLFGADQGKFIAGAKYVIEYIKKQM